MHALLSDQFSSYKTNSFKNVYCRSYCKIFHKYSKVSFGQTRVKVIFPSSKNECLIFFIIIKKSILILGQIEFFFLFPYTKCPQTTLDVRLIPACSTNRTTHFICFIDWDKGSKIGLVPSHCRTTRRVGLLRHIHFFNCMTLKVYPPCKI